MEEKFQPTPKRNKLCKAMRCSTMRRSRGLGGLVACAQGGQEHLLLGLHRRAIRTTNLLERMFGEERRRTKTIPHAFGAKAVMKLMFAALMRARQGWRNLVVTPFGVKQIQALRERLAPTNPATIRLPAKTVANITVRSISHHQEMQATIDAFASGLVGWEPQFRFNDNPESADRNARLGDTRAILGVLQRSSKTGKTILACYDGDQPVGLASVEPRHEPWSGARYLAIDAIVTHPRTLGIGRKLIELSVRASRDMRCGGELRVDPFSERARRAFRRLHFEDEGVQMVLHLKHGIGDGTAESIHFRRCRLLFRRLVAGMRACVCPRTSRLTEQCFRVPGQIEGRLAFFESSGLHGKRRRFSVRQAPDLHRFGWRAVRSVPERDLCRT
jgi:hypothetical protein